jgi:hypothetical protein
MRKTNLKSSDEEPYDRVDWLGLIVKEYNPSQRHVGFLYKEVEEGPAKFCELRFHHELYVGASSSGMNWIDIELNETDKISLAGWIEATLSDQVNMPYGFDWDGQVFDSETDQMIDPPIGKGLTCASFIVAVFKNYGHEVLDPATWTERQDDIAWQKSFVEIMRKKGVPKEHIDALELDIPSIRVRPEEVAGAATLSEDGHWPATFDAALAQAQLIIEDIRTIGITSE